MTVGLPPAETPGISLPATVRVTGTPPGPSGRAVAGARSEPAPRGAAVAPRPLLVWSAAAVVVAVVATDPLVRGLVALAALDVCVTLARPGRRLRPLLAGVAVAAVVAVVLDALLSHTGAHTLWVVPTAIPGIGGPVTVEALAYGGATGLGIAAAVLAAAPLGLALEPHQLVGALPRALERTAVGLAAAAALLPQVVRTAVAVRDAQRMRGWRPRGPRSWADVAVPVAVTAIEDSLQLAEAMEARGYGSGRRTHYPSSARSPAAGMVVAVAALAALAVVVVRAHAGALDWYPFPTLAVPAADPAAVVACLLLAAPVVAWRRPS